MCNSKPHIPNTETTAEIIYCTASPFRVNANVATSACSLQQTSLGVMSLSMSNADEPGRVSPAEAEVCRVLLCPGLLLLQEKADAGQAGGGHVGQGQRSAL